MVNSVPLSSQTFTRVTSTMSRNVFVNDIMQLEQSIQQTQEQLSSGIRILQPSDDPIGENQVLIFQNSINQNNAFSNNVDSANSMLSTADSSLQNMENLVNQAQNIVLSALNSSSNSSSALSADAAQVNQLIQQAMSIGNTNFNGQNIFAGSQTQITPFSLVGGAVAYGGDNSVLNTNISQGVTAASTVSPDSSFGVFSSGITGVNLASVSLAPIDLNPALRTATQLSAINGGKGFSPGSITITGAASATINLSTAGTVNDVINLINAPAVTAVTNVTVAINAANNRLVLTRGGGGNITVAEVGNGTTAQSLGIVATAIPSPVTGNDIHPALTKDTLVSDLFGGLGLNANGIVITNSTSTSTFTATLGAAVFVNNATNTIGNVLNAINNAGVNVDARIDPDGKRLDIFSRLSGGHLTIAENGGTTANNLGLLLDPNPVTDPSGASLKRAEFYQLNNGNGVSTSTGNDITITQKNGTQVGIDLDNLSTVNDLINAINANPNLTASVIAGNKIQITDSSVGAGSFSIQSLNGSQAASDLGLQNPAVGNTITGSALTFSGVEVKGIFAGLVNLRNALLNNDPVNIQNAGNLLSSGLNNLLNARGVVGAQETALNDTKSSITSQNTQLQQSLSQVKDIDFAQASTLLTQQMTNLQAALAVAAKILNISVLNYL